MCISRYPTFNLDGVFPRLCTLAISSLDRKTRVCASEVIHTQIITILARIAGDSVTSKRRKSDGQDSSKYMGVFKMFIPIKISFQVIFKIAGVINYSNCFPAVF
jgi:hypothetical protein